MRSFVFRIVAFLLLAPVSGCGDDYLRGSVVQSEDGKTYLAIVDDNGGGCGPIRIDGVEWPHSIGVQAEVEPGWHTIECGADIQFEIPEGVVFSFDYWGP